MSGPDFRDLIGDEGTPEELERLRRDARPARRGRPAAGAAAAPRRAARPPRAGSRSCRRRRKEAAFALAAAVAAAAFGVGFLVGNRGSTEFAAKGAAVAMHGTAPGSAARASILVGDRDEVGNWPLLVRISGLKPLAEASGTSST